MNKLEAIDLVLSALGKEMPILWDWDTDVQHKEMDGKLTLRINDFRFDFNTIIKKELKTHQLFKLLEQKRGAEDFLLVADKLYPTIKQELKKNNINYLEANGNVFINRKNFYIYIDTQKTLQAPKATGNRAFTKTGLKVVFHFLLEPQLLNQTQREIADTAQVALGNIPQIINGLLESNMILKRTKNEFLIKDYETLLHKWIVEYEQRLKPRLFKQRFKFIDRNQNWKDVALDFQKSVWGGEPAGDLITNYLRPERLTLYTKELTNDLIKNYKIIPDKEGDIWVYELFWNEKLNTKTAPLQLVYADLMISNDKRCRETANIIFNEHIKPNL